MRVLCISKYPPIEGGVSTLCYFSAIEAARNGHEVEIVTNSLETEYGRRELILTEDRSRLDRKGINVSYTQPLVEGCYVPSANPFVSKLLGLALAVSDRFHPELIVGWYMEPYGLAASLLGTHLGIPVGFIHAGSDIGSLAEHPDLGRAYSMVAGSVDYCLTSDNPRIAGKIAECGFHDEAIQFSQYFPLPKLYRKTASELNLAKTCTEAVSFFRAYPLDQLLIDNLLQTNLKKLDTAAPTIGVYGKIGDGKGSFQLLDALEEIASSGRSFNFITIPSGSAALLTNYYERITSSKLLSDSSWILPPVAPWRIPNLLALCDIACNLEHNFHVEFHSSVITREILASGTTLACTQDAIKSVQLDRHIVDDLSAMVIDDPNDTSTLSGRIGSLIDDRARCAAIGRRGKAISALLEDHAPGKMPLLQIIDRVFRSESTDI